MRRVLNEKYAIELLANRPHPFITRYLCAYKDSERVYLGMEHIGGGEHSHSYTPHRRSTPEQPTPTAAHTRATQIGLRDRGG